MHSIVWHYINRKKMQTSSPHTQHHPNPETSKNVMQYAFYTHISAQENWELISSTAPHDSPKIPLPTNRLRRSPNRNQKHPPAQLTVSTLTPTKPQNVIDIHPPVSLRPPNSATNCTPRTKIPHPGCNSATQSLEADNHLHPRLYSVQFGDVARKCDRFICTPLSLPSRNSLCWRLRFSPWFRTQQPISITISASSGVV